MSVGLTKKQHSILSFIESFAAEKGYSPTYRDIMTHFSLSSPGSVYKYVQILKRKNLLSAEKGCGRSIQSTTKPKALFKEPSVSIVEIPFIGHIEAGCPIEIFPQNHSIAVPKFLVPQPNTTYVLRVRGISFHEEHLDEGDLLLVEGRSEAEDGETVLALINRHETVILQYHREGTNIRLTGKNPHHHPVILRHENVQIQGVLVGLIRAY
jgi:repressor LexA